MIKTIKPYGYVKESLVQCYFESMHKYYLKDISANIYEIEKSIFEEKNNDRD